MYNPLIHTDIPNTILRTFFNGLQSTGTHLFTVLFVVCNGYIAVHHKQIGSRLCADPAADTASITHRCHIFSLVPVGTLNCWNLRLMEICHGNNCSGAGLDTGSASDAVVIIHNGEAVYHMDGVVLAGVNAVAKPETTECTSLDAGHKGCGSA